MSIRDEPSSPSTTDCRLRPKPQETTLSENRFAPLRDHSLEDVVLRTSNRGWPNHSLLVKDEDEKPSALEKDSDQESDAEQETLDSDDEVPLLQEDRVRGEPQACLFVARYLTLFLGCLM